MNHDWDLLLMRQIIEDDLRTGGAIALDQTLTVLPDHQRGSLARVILRRDICPVIALHPLVDLARVLHFFGELALRDARLRIRIGTIGGDVRLAALALSIHYVIEGVGPPGLELARPGPQGARALHGADGLAVDEKRRPAGGLDSEQEIRSIARDGGALFHFLRLELRNLQLGGRDAGSDREKECQLKTHQKSLSQSGRRAEMPCASTYGRINISFVRRVTWKAAALRMTRRLRRQQSARPAWLAFRPPVIGVVANWFQKLIELSPQP